MIAQPQRRADDLTAVRVLLAEPHESLRDDYAGFLRGCGATVACAGNGVECIEQLRLIQPHVLVLEPEIPWGGGAGVIDWMLSDPALPTTPVIALTAARDLDQLRRILKFPLYDLVVKPLAPKQLATKIRWVVDFAPQLGSIGWPR
jgi:two-component system chemotaxis response regulator CheB